MKYKTELAQATRPRIPHVNAALLCALTFVLRALFVCVWYVHAAWHAYQHEKTKERGSNDAATAPRTNTKRGSNDAATAPRTNTKRKKERKSGADMALEAADAAEKTIQMYEESEENYKRKQAVIKKISKAAKKSKEAAREAKEAADAARKNCSSEAAKRTAAAKDDAAKRLAKKTRKAIKKAGGGDDDNSSNCGKDDSAGKSHIEQVLQDLAGGPCWNMVKKVLSSLKFPYSKNHNALYGFDDMCRVLLAACMGDGKASSIDGQCKRGFRSDKKTRKNGGKRGRGKNKSARKKGDYKMPSRQWIFSMINSVRPDYMVSRCNIMLYRSVLLARRRGMLRGAVDVSIDMHDVPFYAKCMRLFYAVKSHSKSGTHTFNRLATLHCVTNGQRLTLGVDVVRREDETADVVGRLLEFCHKKYIIISSLTMDRGFCSVAVINEVKRRGVPTIMPAVKTSRVQDKIRLHDSGKIGAVTEHEFSSRTDSASYTLIILERKKKDLLLDEESKMLDKLYGNKDDDGTDQVIKKYLTFATTMDGEWSREGGDPYAIAEFYRRRWGIENSYKCYEKIRPRTTSTKYPVRILWWFLPFVMYNAWILCRFMASRKTGIPDTDICTLGELVSCMQVAAFSAPKRKQKGKPPPD